MSIISANTLFHFTRERESLLKILETGFRPSYCKEFGTTTGGVINESHIPMVCFCDLPLSSIEKHSFGHNWKYNGNEQHSDGYGKFAIGMAKDWGQAAKLNPVTYITNQSYYLDFAIFLNKYGGEMANMTGTWQPLYHLNPSEFPDPESVRSMQLTLAPVAVRSQLLNEIAHSLFSYIKPYQDVDTGKRYYDEREWRFVIPNNAYQGYNIPVLMRNSTTYIFDKELDKFKNQINSDPNMNLKFDAKDIKYIIVEKDDDIEPVFQKLRSLTDKYKEADISRLMTRVITGEQIHEDF